MISKTYHRYIWLLDTLLKDGPLTYNEIVQRWESIPGRTDALPLRTFHEHRKGIMEMFGVEIECNKTRGYKYYIKNPEVLKASHLSQWLLNHYSIPQGFVAMNGLQDRILLDEIPYGTSHLDTVVSALQENRVLAVDYQKYGGHADTLHIHPYALKVYNRRWYILCFCQERDMVICIALDRIRELHMLPEQFSMPYGFSARKYFASGIGIYHSGDQTIHKVVVRVYGHAVDYMRSLPLHSSQEEVSTKLGEYSDFSYRLRLTPELTTHILSMGPTVEVLEPQELRDEIKAKLTAALGRYK